MLYKIKLVYDGNFAKSRDIDREVGKALKMFKGHLETKSKPLGDNSDIECVYEYTNLSHNELRIMKKLLKTSGPTVRLKTMESAPIPGNHNKKKSADKNKDHKRKGRDDKNREGAKRHGKMKVGRGGEGSSGDEVESVSTHESTSSVSELGSDNEEPLGVETDPKGEAITEARELCKRMQGLLEMLERL